MSDEINETADDLSVTAFEEGAEVVRQIDKEILSKGGAWVTVMYKYQELDPKTQDYGDVKYTIRRYQKMQGRYRQKSKFNITNNAQAQKIAEILQQWSLD